MPTAWTGFALISSCAPRGLCDSFSAGKTLSINRVGLLSCLSVVLFHSSLIVSAAGVGWDSMGKGFCEWAGFM